MIHRTTIGESKGSATKAYLYYYLSLRSRSEEKDADLLIRIDTKFWLLRLVCTKRENQLGRCYKQNSDKFFKEGSCVSFECSADHNGLLRF